MNQLTNNQTMTSREIASLANKSHNDLMKAIRKMEPAWLKVSGGNFSLAKYIDYQGKPRPMYQFSKTECLYIATKFNDEARARLILRWEELEQQQQVLREAPVRILPALPVYEFRSIADLTKDFHALVFEEIAKIPSQRSRMQLVKLIKYYTTLVNQQA